MQADSHEKYSFSALTRKRMCKNEQTLIVYKVDMYIHFIPDVFHVKAKIWT